VASIGLWLLTALSTASLKNSESSSMGPISSIITMSASFRAFSMAVAPIELRSLRFTRYFPIRGPTGCWMCASHPFLFEA